MNNEAKSRLAALQKIKEILNYDYINYLFGYRFYNDDNFNNERIRLWDNSVYYIVE